MKKQLLFLLITILSLNCYSQINYEKGYYIDNTDQKIICLIKNIDWKSNPTKFEYKLSENSEPQEATIKSVKEFVVDNVSKYIRSTVNIDKTNKRIDDLSYDKNPIFQKEELFLKVLVDGKASLYQYVENNSKKYFYNLKSSNIEQLIFKSYKISDYQVGTNNRFKQQLLNDLKCQTIEIKKVENLDYKEKDLVDFFLEYNQCNGEENLNFNYKEKQKRDLFNLTIRPRLNSSSLTVELINSNFYDTDFGNKTGFGFGLETEFILPFNKNKWAITIEPTYQSFKSEKTNYVNDFAIEEIKANVDYTSIELPVGLRHYFFLNNNSKIFANVSYVANLSSNSSVEFFRNDGTNLFSLKDKSKHNFGLGIGYKQNDRYSLEIRYQTYREILGNFISWNSKYKTVSMIFGYSLF